MKEKTTFVLLSSANKNFLLYIFQFLFLLFCTKPAWPPLSGDLVSSELLKFLHCHQILPAFAFEFNFPSAFFNDNLGAFCTLVGKQALRSPRFLGMYFFFFVKALGFASNQSMFVKFLQEAGGEIVINSGLEVYIEP